MQQELLEKIKSRGYWQINFKPLENQEIELPECKELVMKSAVEFRGWDYPHIPRRSADDTGLIARNDSWEGWVDWGEHKEIWRLYQSGQFIHFRAVHEDWFEETEYGGDFRKNVQPREILSVVWSVHLITEIFEFLSRLTRNAVYKEGVEVRISLVNNANRKLTIFGFDRAPLLGEYRAGGDIEFVGRFKSDQVLSHPKDLALEAIIYFLQRFSWDDPSIEVIKNDQERLLNRRL